MHAFFSWLTSQSGVSLLVALVALVGVLVTTWWNNKAADKRRRADQAAADQRRKDDQAAEDARRKADDDRRERERLEQLQGEDWERQRKAVADCTGAIFTAAQGVHDAVIQVQRDKPTVPLDTVLVEKAMALGRFYREAAAHLNQCDLEVTQPHVSEQIVKVWACIEHDQKELDGNGEVRSSDVWLATAKNLQPLSAQTLKELRKLTIVARLSLLEYPKHMAKQPVVSLDNNGN